MQKFVSRVVLTASLVVPSLASAAPYLATGDTLTLFNGTGSYGGGEFIANAAGTSTFDSFTTFCMQYQEHITADNSTVYTVQNLGYASAGAGAAALTEEVAYLYTNFRLGTLAGYDTSTAVAHNLSASALQLAFWTYQGEKPTATYEPAVVDLARSFMLAASQALDSGEWSGYGNVRIANLINASGAAVQDQITLIEGDDPPHVPEPATFMLFGAAFIGVASRLRRRN